MTTPAEPIERRLKRLVRSIGVYYRSWRGALVTLALLLLTIPVTVLADAWSSWIALYALVAVPIGVLLLLLAQHAAAVHDQQMLLGYQVARMGSTLGTRPVITDRRGPLRKQTGEPTVSVVLTAFNDAEHIRDCLISLQQQTWASWECVVLDDNSTDATADLAFDAVAGDPRFSVVVNAANVGLAGQRNYGASITGAPLVTFLDADDLLFPAALESRVRPLLSSRDPSLAGVYCDWMQIGESEDLAALAFAEWAADPRPARQRVTWLSSPDDAPFIASAPLLRRDAFVAAGGFRLIDVAEDADLWNRMLRAGFYFEPVPELGVAYRQKQQSMIRGRSLASARTIAGMAERNAKPISPEEAREMVGPYPFTEPFSEYMPRITYFRRVVMALAFTYAADEDPAALLEELEQAFEPYMAWVVDVGQLAVAAAQRATRPTPALQARRPLVERKVRTALAPLVERAHSGASAWRGADAPIGVTSRDEAPVERRALTPKRRARHGRSTTSGDGGRILLLPAAAYHVDEAGPLAEQLALRGFSPVFMANDRRWPDIAAPMRAFDFPIYDAPDAGDWVADLGAVVAFNDWGEYYRDYVVAANEAGVPTFAKVEGVQDFDDVDVGRERRPYRTAAHVLCQGRNDAEALAGRDCHVVGSTRMERIWLAPPRVAKEPLAVINLNFTYGVLTEATDLFITTALEGCRRAGIPATISLHPAQRDVAHHPGLVADEPMRHLLTKATVLISRFSTVPFEAMARGVPFIYHNPHGESVPTFQESGGAFPISTNARELAEAIAESMEWIDGYRDRCADFFLGQVDVQPDLSSEARAADVIATILKS